MRNIKVYTASGIKSYIHVVCPATALPSNFSPLLSSRKLSKFEIVAACSSSSHTNYIYSKMNSKCKKVLPMQATKTLRVGRGIALPYLRPRH